MGRSPEALERRREYDRKRAKAKNAAYYAANKERENARCQAYHSGNRNRRLEVKAAYYKANAAELSARQTIRRNENRTEYLERERRRREAGTDKAYQAQWRAANAERERERLARWARENKDRTRAKVAARRAAKLRATPAWANQAAIEAIYAEATRLSAETETAHEVDHIVPLLGANVCGLHVENNLRVITRTANRRKHNHLEEEAVNGPVRPPAVT